MNTYIHNGILYRTNKKYLRVDISDRVEVREDDNLDLLYVKIRSGMMADEFVMLHPEFEMIRNLTQNKKLDPIKIVIPEYSLDGLKIRPRRHKYRITQVVTFGISLFSHYDESSLTIMVTPTTPKSEYLNHLSQIPFIEVDMNSDFEYKNYNNVMLDKKLEINSTSDMPVTPKNYFTRYIFNEPHMIYQLNNRILKELMQYNILNLEKAGDPDKDLKNSSDVLTYRIGNESMEKMHVFPSDYLRRAMAVSVPVEYQIKTQSLSVALDIRNKFMNFDLISNVTSVEMKDAYDNPFLVQLWWDPQMSDLGDRESTIDEYGNFTHLLTIRCTVNYYILRDEEELVRINRVKGVMNLVEKLAKQGFQVKYLNDKNTGEKILTPLRPLSEWEVEEILNK